MEVAVQKISGEATSKKVKLDEGIFGIEPNDHAIYLDVKRILAAQRQGTHKAKERGEVSYSTKKIKKQKGSGTARAGSRRSPIFRGGGRMFGPRPRNYDIDLNKKVKNLARVSALTYKAKEQGIIVVEDFSFEAPKTKEFIKVRENLKVADKHTLLVLAEQDKNVYLSSRNLDNVKVTTINELNTYDIMRSKVVVFSESSINKIQN